MNVRSTLSLREFDLTVPLTGSTASADTRDFLEKNGVRNASSAAHCSSLIGTTSITRMTTGMRTLLNERSETEYCWQSAAIVSSWYKGKSNTLSGFASASIRQRMVKG